MGRAGAVYNVAGWIDRMMAEFGRMGRMVEAMLSGLVRRLKMGNVLPVCPSVRSVRSVVMYGKRGRGPTISWAGLGWAGLAGMTQHMQNPVGQSVGSPHWMEH